MNTILRHFLDRFYREMVKHCIGCTPIYYAAYSGGFTTTKLTASGTPLAKTFLDAFETRMLQRRNTKLVHVIKYLENPSFIKERYDQCGEKIVRKDIEIMILQFWQRLFPN